MIYLLRPVVRFDPTLLIWSNFHEGKRLQGWYYVKNFRDTNMTRTDKARSQNCKMTRSLYGRWLFGWRYISSLHSTDELQQERNSCPLLRSCFIGSCHVGVSKRFSRSISLAVFCLYTHFVLADQISCRSYVAVFIVCGPIQLVTHLWIFGP